MHSINVWIMMVQMMVMFGAGEIDNMIEVKLARLKERMEDEDTETSEVKDFLMENETGDQARA